MTKKFDIVATVAEWTDKATGKKMKRTLSVGAVYESPRGNLVLKLEAVPVSRDWSGWAALKPCYQPAEERPLPPGRKVSAGMPPAPPATPQTEEDEDLDAEIPF